MPIDEGCFYQQAAEAVALQALRRAGMSDAEAVVSHAFAEVSGPAPADPHTAAATGPQEYIGGRSPPDRREVPHEHIEFPEAIHIHHHFHIPPKHADDSVDDPPYQGCDHTGSGSGRGTNAHPGGQAPEFPGHGMVLGYAPQSSPVDLDESPAARLRGQGEGSSVVLPPPAEECRSLNDSSEEDVDEVASCGSAVGSDECCPRCNASRPFGDCDCTVFAVSPTPSNPAGVDPPHAPTRNRTAFNTLSSSEAAHGHDPLAPFLATRSLPTGSSGSGQAPAIPVLPGRASDEPLASVSGQAPVHMPPEHDLGIRGLGQFMADVVRQLQHLEPGLGGAAVDIEDHFKHVEYSTECAG